MPLIVSTHGPHTHRIPLGKSDFVTLTAWLPETASTLPTQPHHQVGVGAFVMNQREEVLVIQERSGVTAGIKNFWKLPGGLVDPHESIADAVVREVREETGIHVVFGSVAAFRESHAETYGPMTDLYCGECVQTVHHACTHCL